MPFLAGFVLYSLFPLVYFKISEGNREEWLARSVFSVLAIGTVALFFKNNINPLNFSCFLFIFIFIVVLFSIESILSAWLFMAGMIPGILFYFYWQFNLIPFLLLAFLCLLIFSTFIFLGKRFLAIEFKIKRKEKPVYEKYRRKKKKRGWRRLIELLKS